MHLSHLIPSHEPSRNYCMQGSDQLMLTLGLQDCLGEYTSRTVDTDVMDMEPHAPSKYVHQRRVLELTCNEGEHRNMSLAGIVG